MIAISIKNKDTKNVLCKDVPLEEYELLHLKRVRKKKEENDMVEIAVCPYSSYHTLKSSVQEIRDQYPKETIPVARYSPISKTEFKDWSQYWPINYHPTELERNREKGLDEAELAAITKFRKRLESDNENIAAMSDSNFLHHAAILVNPITQEILATSKRAYEELILRYGKEYVYHHPLITPTMVCINHIANIVSGIIPPEDGKIPFDNTLSICNTHHLE